MEVNKFKNISIKIAGEFSKLGQKVPFYVANIVKEKQKGEDSKDNKDLDDGGNSLFEGADSEYPDEDMDEGIRGRMEE